jgi:hypothetical protein
MVVMVLDEGEGEGLLLQEDVKMTPDLLQEICHTNLKTIIISFQIPHPRNRFPTKGPAYRHFDYNNKLKCL